MDKENLACLEKQGEQFLFSPINYYKKSKSILKKVKKFPRKLIFLGKNFVLWEKSSNFVIEK